MKFAKIKYLLVILTFNACCHAISGAGKPAEDVDEKDPVRSFIPLLKIQTTYLDDPTADRKNQPKTTSWCSGTLVNGKYIVTALHCLAPRDFNQHTLLSKKGFKFDIDELTIFLPKHLSSLDDSLFFNIDLKSQNPQTDNSQQLSDQINEIYIPPANPKWGYYPDLVILKLDKEAWLPQTSQVIIPMEGQINFINPTATTAYGWGPDYASNSNGVGKDGFLRETPIYNLMRSKYPLETKFKIPTYPADDGAPILKKLTGNNYQLLGIISNYGNDNNGWTAAVDLSQYHDWSVKILEKNRVPKGTIRCTAWSECSVPDFERED